MKERKNEGTREGIAKENEKDKVKNKKT